MAAFDFLENYWGQQLTNLQQGSSGGSLHPRRKWHHQLLSVGSKAHKGFYILGHVRTDLERVCNSIRALHFSLSKPSDVIASWPRKWVWMYLPSFKMHYINDWCCIIITCKSHMRVDILAFICIFRTNDSKYYDNSRSGMSDVAFRTAPPVVGLSCCLIDLQTYWRQNVPWKLKNLELK